MELLAIPSNYQLSCLPIYHQVAGRTSGIQEKSTTTSPEIETPTMACSVGRRLIIMISLMWKLTWTDFPQLVTLVPAVIAPVTLLELADALPVVAFVLRGCAC